MKLHALLPKTWLWCGLAAALWAAVAAAPLHAQFDDHGDTAATATLVNLNSTTPGVLNSLIDVDYFRVILPDPARLVVFTTGAVDTIGSLRNATDQEIASNDDDIDFNFRIEADLQAGTYYIRVTGYAGAMGAYSLRVETSLMVQDDHGDTAATATPIAPNSTTAGVLNPANDADYFRVVLPAPATLFVVATGTTGTTGRLHDSNDQLIAMHAGDGSNINFRLQEDLAPGTYYIVVTGTGGIGSYVLTVQASIRPIAPGVTTAAVSNIMTTGATFGGVVTGEGGANVTQRGVVYGTTPNPVLGHPAFVVLNSGSGPGAFSVASASLAVGTRYFARAFAVNSAGVGYGDEVEFTTPDDHGDTAATATPVGAAASVNGILSSPGDVDYFRIVFAGPVHLAVFTTGAVDTVGSLRDANDQEIVGSSGGGAGANFRIAQNIAAGTYYIRVAGAGGGTGNYTLRLEPTTLAAVATAIPADVSPFGATLAGNISSDGGTTVTQRGVVYGTHPNPTLADAVSVLSGSGPGSFSAIVSLVPETEYYARAFAVNTAGTAYGNEVQLTTPSGARIVNLSLRARAGEGEQSLLMGFNLAGVGSKPLLLRGIGPALTGFGVSGALPDPFLQLFSPFTAIASNEDWGGNAAVAAAAASVGAFALPAGSRDAAMLQTLTAGTYTTRVGGGNGLALAELYDAGPIWTPRLINVSTRTQIGAGAEILIAGFAIAGVGEKTLLIRAVGPTLASFQVAGTLADPRIDLYRSGTAAPISANDNWGGAAPLRSAFERAGAFALPADSRDAAVLVTLPVGSYTAQVSGVGGGTGVVLFEIYEM